MRKTHNKFCELNLSFIVRRVSNFEYVCEHNRGKGTRDCSGPIISFSNSESENTTNKWNKLRLHRFLVILSRTIFFLFSFISSDLVKKCETKNPCNVSNNENWPSTFKKNSYKLKRVYLRVVELKKLVFLTWTIVHVQNSMKIISNFRIKSKIFLFSKVLKFFQLHFSRTITRII